MASVPSTDPTAALRAALRLLSIRSRSEQEIVERLRRRGFGAEVVAKVVEDLAARGFVDDRAFAVQRARSQVLHRHVGPRRLKEELRQMGVTTEIVRETIRQVFQEVDEETVARAGATKRLKALRHASNPVARRRLAAYLVRQGFSPETVRRVVATLLTHKE